MKAKWYQSVDANNRLIRPRLEALRPRVELAMLAAKRVRSVQHLPLTAGGRRVG